MDYVLVGDNCTDCCYVSNAFSLLRYSFKKLLIKNTSGDLLSSTLTSVPDSSAIFVCKNLISYYYHQVSDTANAVKKNVISWGQAEADCKLPESKVHFLKMPFSKHELETTLAEHKNSKDTLIDINHPVFQKFVGQSKVITEIKSMIMQVADSDTSVIILGQSGTGKDIIASCIHQLSSRKNNPFVPINCGAIPTELMESELFGHEKGAFTGALARRAGRFEVANSGTLFLDEIGDMPLAMQVKLLRVLQDRKLERVGSNNTINVDVRIITATHKNLENMIAENHFREDLYYRLSVFPLNVPSLSERKEDIPLLIDYQLDKIYQRLKHRVAFTENAITMLCDYPWPGNIRELQNFLERMVILYPDQVVNEKQLNTLKKKK